MPNPGSAVRDRGSGHFLGRPGPRSRCSVIGLPRDGRGQVDPFRPAQVHDQAVAVLGEFCQPVGSLPVTPASRRGRLVRTLQAVCGRVDRLDCVVEGFFKMRRGNPRAYPPKYITLSRSSEKLLAELM